MQLKMKNQFQKNWVKQKAIFSEKELNIKGFQVMQRWEDNYMKSLAAIATSRGGNVLEIGFGLGISATYIQKSKKIKTHTIIECHPDVIKRAKTMFREEIRKKRLILKQGFWEDITPKIKSASFDGILFDSSPLDKETVFFHYFPFFKEAYRLLKKDGVFTYFSDEATGFSNKHIRLLKKVGFKKINFKICRVRPPKSCRYWKHKTIIAPIVIK